MRRGAELLVPARGASSPEFSHIRSRNPVQPRAESLCPNRTASTNRSSGEGTAGARRHGPPLPLETAPAAAQSVEGASFGASPPPMFCRRLLGDGSRSQPARPDPSFRLASSGVPPGGAGVKGERGRGGNAKVGRRERMTLWARAARRWGNGTSGAGGGSSDCGAGKGGGIQGRGGRGSARGIRGEVGLVVDIAYEQRSRGCPGSRR